MPNYDFICTQCDHKFSASVSIAEMEKMACPKCGGKVRQSFLGHLAGFIAGKNGKPNDCGPSCGGG